MEALCFCVVHPSFCPSMLLSSAIGISCTSQQYWNLREVITATNRLNDYSFGESGTGLGSRIRQKIWIDVGQCFAAMSNRCWHLVNECTNFTAHSKVDVILHTISHSFKDFTYRFHINMYEAIFFSFLNNWHRHLHASFRSLHLFACHGNADMKTFSTDIGQMQQWRHHMTTF